MCCITLCLRHESFHLDEKKTSSKMLYQTYIMLDASKGRLTWFYWYTFPYPQWWA